MQAIAVTAERREILWKNAERMVGLAILALLMVQVLTAPAAHACAL